MEAVKIFDQVLLFAALPAIGIAASFLYLRGRTARVRTIAAHELLDALDQLEALARRSKNRAQQIEKASAEVHAANDHRRALSDQTNRLFQQVMSQSLRDRQWVAQYAELAPIAEFDARRARQLEAVAKLNTFLETLDVALSEAQAATRA